MDENARIEPQSEIQFTSDVFPSELEQIQLRRKRQKLSAKGIQAALQVFHAAVGPHRPFRREEDHGSGKLSRESMAERMQRYAGNLRDFFGAERRHRPQIVPSSKLGLKGLAFSGGGLRSATFNLGVIQAFARQGLLKQFDYLSTVSGGGYIGSALSSLFNSGASGGQAIEADGPGFPLLPNSGGPESHSLSRLRRKSAKYLSPANAVDAARMATSVLRGFALNTLLFLPYVVLAAGLNHLFLGGRIAKLFLSTGKPDLTEFFQLSPYFIIVLGVVAALWKPLSSWMQKKLYRLVPLLDALALTAIVLSLAVIAAECLGALVLHYAYLRRHLTGVAEAWLANAQGFDLWHWAWFLFAWLMTKTPIWFKPLVGFLPLIAAIKVFKDGGKMARPLAIASLGLIPVLVALILYLDLAVWFSLGEAFKPLPMSCAACASGIAFLKSEGFCAFIENAQGSIVGLWLLLFSLNAGAALGASRLPGQPLRRFILALIGFPMLWLLADWLFQFWGQGLYHPYDLIGFCDDLIGAYWWLLPLSLFLALALRYYEPARESEGILRGTLRELVLTVLVASLWVPVSRGLLWSIQTTILQRSTVVFMIFTGRTAGPALILLALVLAFRFSRLYAGSSTRIQHFARVLGALTLADCLLYPACRAYDALWPRAANLVPWGGFDPHTYALMIAAMLLWYAIFLLVDVNSTSLHRVYRDQLAKAYLFIVKDGGFPQPNTAQKLSQLEGAQGGPYHLINASLNLPASHAHGLKGRRAGFFILSRNWVGGPQTGYQKTGLIEHEDPNFDLGTALAISGAAASPNMGIFTVGPLVPFMTMLNVRLAYWLPNPRPSGLRRMLRKVVPRVGNVGYSYLLKEMFSQIDENELYVNVSDGGHLENLGAYELLRRHCAVVVASDAEADPTLSFGSLANLLRFASIDLGITIDLDLDQLRIDAQGLSHSHTAVATIHYSDQEKGTFIYIKSSLTGFQDEVVRGYKATHPDFPHESTADQFFDEAQFEAYRSLGYQIGSTLLKDKKVALLLKKD